jgi:hypothetical protein
MKVFKQGSCFDDVFLVDLKRYGPCNHAEAAGHSPQPRSSVCNGGFGSSRRLSEHEAHVRVVGDDLLHHVEERLALASLGLRQP